MGVVFLATGALLLLTPKPELFVVLLLATWFQTYWEKRKRKKELRAWVQDAWKERDEKEHPCLTLTSDTEIAISTLPNSSQIRQLVLDKEWDPASLVVLLAKRCRQYGRGPCNAITEELYQEAYDLATKQSMIMPKTSNPSSPSKQRTSVFPLLGVPISVKDVIHIRGTLSTCGLACRTRHRHTKDALMVKLLKDAGALPLCRGNTTQLLMLPESTNYVWGRSRNPWDLKRTTGGSSGGDAALVAMQCVPLALASDVAGSVRIPAAFCGIVGFKPTSSRLTRVGVSLPKYQNKSGVTIAIPSTLGAMGGTVQDCVQFMRAVCVPKMWKNDPSLPPLSFDEISYENSEKLVIGYFETDGWFEPCEASKRAVRESITALKKAGHTCVPFQPPTDGWFNYGLLVGINAAEGNMRSFVKALEGEDMIPEYNYLYKSANLPNFLRPVLQKVTDERRAHLLSQTSSGGISVEKLWEHTADLIQMRSQWADAMASQKVNAILHPAVPIPALLHGMGAQITPAFSYMFLANLLLWPSGVVPVTTIREEETFYLRNSTGEVQHKADFINKQAEKVMKDSAGLPMSVSVMTTAFQDETCLRVMKEVERAVNFQAAPIAYKEAAAMV